MKRFVGYFLPLISSAPLRHEHSEAQQDAGKESSMQGTALMIIFGYGDFK
jgi:hypothetical protein